MLYNCCKALALLLMGQAALERDYEQKHCPLTLVELPAQLVVRAAFDHFGDVLCFLVDWHSPDDSSLGWWGHHFDLNGACLGNLAVQLLQFGGILNEGKKGKKSKRVRMVS